MYLIVFTSSTRHAGCVNEEALVTRDAHLDRISILRRRSLVASISFATLLGAVGLGGCGGATPGANSSATTQPNTSSSTVPNGSSTTVTVAPETLTPGDIPDTIAYVPYANTAGRYSFSHPEGWAQTGGGTQVTFSDKYNGVSADSVPASSAPTLATARSTDIAKLKTTEPAFQLKNVSAVTLPGGPGVLIVYRRNSPPDPVTGRSIRQEVQRYEIFAKAHIVTLDLFGAVGADNVDPYTKMSQSLRLS